MDARDLEVRCAGCGAGFAVGTRRCIHCGLPLGARSAPKLFTVPDTPTPSAEPDRDDSAENARLSGLLSGGVMLAVVVASALLRACSE